MHPAGVVLIWKTAWLEGKTSWRHGIMGTVASYPSALNYAVSVQSTSSIFFFHLVPKRLCFLPVLSPSLVFFFFFPFHVQRNNFPLFTLGLSLDRKQCAGRESEWHTERYQLIRVSSNHYCGCSCERRQLQISLRLFIQSFSSPPPFNPHASGL